MVFESIQNRIAWIDGSSMHPSSDLVSRLVDPERKFAKDSLFCRGSMCVITLGDELQQRKHSRREGEKEEGRRKKELEELSKFIHVGEKLSKMWPISGPLVYCVLWAYTFDIEPSPSTGRLPDVLNWKLNHSAESNIQPNTKWTQIFKCLWPGPAEKIKSYCPKVVKINYI